MKNPKTTKTAPKNKTRQTAKKVRAKTVTPKTVDAKKVPLKTYDDTITDAFIKEVDEEVHNDELKVFWNKYGLFVILIVVLGVSAAVGFESIKNWRLQRFQTQTEEYLAAVQPAENAEATLQALEKIATEDNGLYGQLARLQMANVLMEQNKDAEAYALLNTIVNNENIQPRIKHLAALKLATYQLDSAPRADIEALLNPVVAANNAWSPLAQEFLAMTAIRDGDIASAKEIYENLMQNPEISENFKNRIQDMLSALNDM